MAEGRCALVTSFTVFKFILVYALVQMACANFIYVYGLDLGRYQVRACLTCCVLHTPSQYLIQDLGVATVLAAFMALGRPQLELTPSQPPQRLVALPVLIPVAALCTLVLTWQVVALALLRAQPWYVPFDPQQQDGACFAVQDKDTRCTAVRVHKRRVHFDVSNDVSKAPCCGLYHIVSYIVSFPSSCVLYYMRIPAACVFLLQLHCLGAPTPPPQAPESSTVFLLSLAQLLTAALVLYQGKPFVEPLRANNPLVAAMLLQTAVLLAWTVAGTSGWIAQYVGGLVPLPWAFRMQLLACMLGMLGSAFVSLWCIAWVAGHGRGLWARGVVRLQRRRASFGQEGWVAMTERL